MLKPLLNILSGAHRVHDLGNKVVQSNQKIAMIVLESPLIYTQNFALLIGDIPSIDCRGSAPTASTQGRVAR